MFCRKHDCKWVGCLLWLFTLVLGVLLVIQIPLVTLLTLNRELVIPVRWVEGAINHHLDGDYLVSVGSANLNRNGTITLDQVVVENELGRRVLDAESFQVDFYLPSIVFGGFHPEQVKAAQVSLFDPNAPLGSDESILSLQALNLLRSRGFWSLDDLRVEWGNLMIAGAGTLHPSSWKSALEAPDEGTDPLQSILERITSLKPQLTRLKKPFLQVHLTSSANAETLTEVILLAERMELPFDIGLEEDIRITSSALLSPDRLVPHPTVLRSKRLHFENDTSINHPFIRLKPPNRLSSIQSFVAGCRAELSASLINTPEVSLENPTLRITPGRALKLNLSGQAGIFGNPFSSTASIDILRRSASIDLSGILSITAAILHPVAPEEAREFPIRIEEGVYLDLSTDISLNEPIPEAIRFRAETESFDLKGFSGIYARASGNLYPQEMVLDVAELSVQKPDYHMEGTYLHDFLSNEFRFRIKGGFLPMDISSWMSDWWDEIWENFVLYEIPYVDFDIEGDWDHHDDRRIFGGFRFRDIVLKGMAVESGHASLRSLPYFFELFDLRAFRPEGEASGSVTILNDWETRENELEVYDFVSGFRLKKILPLFGAELEESLSAFELTAPPDLTVKASIYPEIEGKPRRPNHVVVHASTESPLTYKGIQLDALRLSALYSEDILRLDPVEFKLGGGTGEGWIVQRREDARQGKTSAQLTFKDGIPSEVVADIPKLREMVGDRIEHDPNPDPEDHKLDFSIEFSGDLENPQTLLGEGNLDLFSPNLANIRLLGILSRISEELPLPITLGSFQFERVSTSFLLNRGLIEFPDLTLFSPSSQLLAAGTYEMKTQTIDFNAKMQLLGGVKFPILAQLGTLLSPMGKVFEFRVWGEVEDLKWRLYLDPRSWN